MKKIDGLSIEDFAECNDFLDKRVKELHQEHEDYKRKIADYILILEQLHKVAERESKDYDLFESLRQCAIGEEMVLRKVIGALKNIK